MTLAPSRRQTEPSSSPITPPPITTMCSGTLSQLERAGGIDDPIFWSISTPGSGVTDEPVAMTMFFARDGAVADLDRVARR